MAKRVLVADDDPEIRDMVKTLLSDFGYETEAAADGKETENMIDAKEFDLIVLDISMPFADGYHICYKIATRTDKKAPKIVILTARDSEKDKKVGSLSGADFFITKPFEYKVLLDKVVELIGKP